MGKPRWADKSPDNVLFLDKWSVLLGEEWLFVHVLRNPLDTLASLKESGFRLSMPSGLQSQIELYRRYVEAGVDFHERYPDRYRIVSYERLAQSPEDQLSLLMKWLDEEMVPRQLDFNSLDQGIGLEDPKIASTTKVHASSVNRWPEVLLPHEADLIREQL